MSTDCTPRAASTRKTPRCLICGQLACLAHKGLHEISGRRWVCASCREALVTPCSLCGHEHISDELHPQSFWHFANIDAEPKACLGVPLCSHCAPKVHECRGCGAAFSIDSMPASSDAFSKDYCPECFKQRYTKCADCGLYARGPHLTTVTNAAGEERHVCDACLRNARPSILQCSGCDHYFDEDALDAALLARGFVACRACAPQIHACPGCGQLLRPHARCEACAEAYSVHAYSFRPAPIFHGNPADGPFLGIELECDTDSCNIYDRRSDTVQAAVKALTPGRLYVKSDGSLHRGFEQVTHPATLVEIEKERDLYAQLCRIPLAAGFRSHDAGTCGLHVHVGRSYFNDAQGGASEAILRAVWLVERFWPQLFVFSRRPGDDITHWAARYLGPTGAREVIKLKKEQVGLKIDANRYHALNLVPSATVEYRLFRGTLNERTFFATLQLVDSMARIAHDLGDTQLYSLSWNDIIHYREHADLTTYTDKLFGTGGWLPQSRVAVPRMDDTAAWEAVLPVDTLTIPSYTSDSSLGKIKVWLLDLQRPEHRMFVDAHAGTINDLGGFWIVPTVATLELGLAADALVNISGLHPLAVVPRLHPHGAHAVTSGFAVLRENQVTREQRSGASAVYVEIFN
jgi:hypothetical protein